MGCLTVIWPEHYFFRAWRRNRNITDLSVNFPSAVAGAAEGDEEARGQSMRGEETGDKARRGDVNPAIKRHRVNRCYQEVCEVVGRLERECELLKAQVAKVLEVREPNEISFLRPDAVGATSFLVFLDVHFTV